MAGNWVLKDLITLLRAGQKFNKIILFAKIKAIITKHMAYNFTEFKERTKKVEEWLRQEYSGIRTGRAALSILDTVRVDSYGSKMLIKELAGVSVEDPKTLRISPWDMTQAKAIEKAIIDSGMGLSVVTDDRGLRIVFPELTSERRDALVKLSGQKLEEARVSLRAEREKVWEDIQEKEKEGELTEDDKFRLKKDLQDLVDAANRGLEEIAERKEQEIRS